MAKEISKEEYKFSDFFVNVEDAYKDFVNEIHESLIADNYKYKVESKASGFFISYSHPKTKRSILNFLFRKKKLLVRIYCDNYNKYLDVLNSLPEGIISQINKAGVCKRLVDPESCNSKCVMGYDFHIGTNHYQKCRYACFYLVVDDESLPYLVELIKNEKKARDA